MNFPSCSRLLSSFCVASLAVIPSSASRAATLLVDSVTALKSAVFSATPGDVITLKKGVYTTAAAITVRCQGTLEKPITIAAESIGGVELAGTGGFNVVEPAEHVVICGFKFTHLSGKNTVAAGTRHVRFTRNTFQCPGAGAFLSVLGDDAEIDYNDFTDKTTPGSMLAVSGSGNQIARRLWIHHNYFHGFTNGGLSGAEMLRFGLSALGTSTGAGLIEHNLFSGCRGANDLVANRSGGNTYRYNTLLDSPTAQLTLRQGNACVVYGNVFRNTGGLRLFGDRHQVFSNYFEGNYIGVNLGNGDVPTADGTPASTHDRPDDCVITFNTFVDNRTHYQLSRRAPLALGATHTTFANNLLQGGEVAAKIEGPNDDAVWLGNLLWKIGRPGDFPVDGATSADPLLAVGPDGVFRLTPTSPALGAAIGEFLAVAVDQDGQPRPAKKSIGADELSDAPVVGRVLAPANVGPHAEVFDAAPSRPLP